MYVTCVSMLHTLTSEPLVQAEDSENLPESTSHIINNSPVDKRSYGRVSCILPQPRGRLL